MFFIYKYFLYFLCLFVPDKELKGRLRNKAKNCESYYKVRRMAKSVGKNLKITGNVRINRETVIGNNVGIDDFCILSGKIKLKNNIHISAYCALYGGNEENSGIIINNNSGCSARTTLYSITDDFRNAKRIGVMQKKNDRIIISGKIILEENVQIGAHSLVFPNVTIGCGSVVYAMSLIKEDIPPQCIYAGIPAHKIADKI